MTKILTKIKTKLGKKNQFKILMKNIIVSKITLIRT